MLVGWVLGFGGEGGGGNGRNKQQNHNHNNNNNNNNTRAWILYNCSFIHNNAYIPVSILLFVISLWIFFSESAQSLSIYHIYLSFPYLRLFIYCFVFKLAPKCNFSCIIIDSSFLCRVVVHLFVLLYTEVKFTREENVLNSNILEYLFILCLLCNIMIYFRSSF